MIHLDYLGGRWDRSKKTLRAQVQRSRKKGATITLHSEVAAKRRASALRHRDYRLLQGKVGSWRAESAISVRRDTWRVLRWRVKRLSDDFGIRGPASCVIALLEHRETGASLLVSTAHLPAGVEAVWRRVVPTRRRRAHSHAVRRLRRIHRRWRRKFKPDGEVSFNDWNLNLRRSWVRRWVRRAWPAMRPLPKRLLPKRGTHGKRLIDWPVRKRLRRLRFRVHKLHPASDHRGCTLRARIRRRP